MDCNPSTTDQEIVRLSLLDKNNYSCLIERYEAKLTRYIKRFSGLGDDSAQDVLQNTFIKAYKNLNDFDQTLKFSSWIYSIAHNETISYIRSQKNHGTNIGEFDQEALENIASELKLETKAEAGLLKEKVKKVLADLSPDYREILILSFIEQKDYAEISDILSKPMGTVASQISRAKKQFLEKANNLGIKF